MADTLWYSDSGTNGQPHGVEISHTLIIQSLAKIAMKIATVRMMYDVRIQVLLYSSPA
jgi:long-subunit acyl-CoA synthetase (AMP-forming)